MAAQKRRKSRAKQSNQPALGKTALWIAVGFAVLGLALSFYATQMTFRIAAEGIVEASGCTLGDLVNCDVASASSYASMLGIPVAWWGFLFYAFAGLSAMFGATSQRTTGAAPFVAGAFFLSLLAVVFTFVKAWHLYSLGVICIVCVGMYIANFGVAIALGLGLGYSPAGWGRFVTGYIDGVRGNESSLGFSPALTKVAVAVLAIFGIGYVGAVNHQKDISGGISPQEMERAVAQHFRQPQIEVETDPEAAIWGNPDAPVEIVEFADFQCPACKISAEKLRPGLFQYQDDVKLVFMNYPLPGHAMADPAARAGVCAAERGDFWGYHDEVFENQAVLTPNIFVELAEKRGWDAREFAQCMVSEETTARIQEDIRRGRETRLNATPTIFINGRKVSLWDNNPFIQKIIEEELSRLNP